MIEKRGNTISVSKKGIYFSIDAILALAIIFFVVLIAFPLYDQRRPPSTAHEDMLNVLDNLVMSDLKILPGFQDEWLTDPDLTVMEQVGILRAKGQEIQAKDLAEFALEDLETQDNIGLWYGSEQIWNQNDPQCPYNEEIVENVDVANRFVSGIIGEEGDVEGFSGRATLTKAFNTEYFYFGGYVGDGDLTATMDYEGVLKQVDFEIAVSSETEQTSDYVDVDMYVNGQKIENLDSILTDNNCPPGDEFIPCKFSFTEDDDPNHLPKFDEGLNRIEITKNVPHISGGFIKLTYESDEIPDLQERYQFPGIVGLINLFDGYYFPDSLTDVGVLLHLKSEEFPVFLNFGSITIFNETTEGDEFFNVDVNESVLQYLRDRTIPVRLGLRDLVQEGQGNADIISVSDNSGSMDGDKIEEARAANDQLIDQAFETENSRVALVGFDHAAMPFPDDFPDDFTDHDHEWFHEIAPESQASSLHETVVGFSADGGTCICCGIFQATRCLEPNHPQLDQTFESQDIGSDPVNWMIEESGGDVEIVSPGLVGSARALRLSKVNSDPVYMKHYLQPLALSNQYVDGTFQSSMSLGLAEEVEISFFIEQVSGIDDPVVVELNQWGDNDPSSTYGRQDIEINDYIRIRLQDGRIYDHNDNQIGNYNSGEHKISIQVDPSQDAENYELYVDGAPQGNFAPIDPGRRGIHEILFSGEGAQPVTFKVDNVRARFLNPICDNSGFEENPKNIVVMSDGVSTRLCNMEPVPDHNDDFQQDFFDPEDHAIEAACRAYEDYGITVHTVGFDIENDQAAIDTMNLIAQCGNGVFLEAGEGSLVEIFEDIVGIILQAAYEDQTLEIIIGSLSTILHPDSFIDLAYSVPGSPAGLMVTVEKLFGPDGSGDFNIPSDVNEIVDVRVASYSGPRWTEVAEIESSESGTSETFYDINEYGSDYVQLGDPYTLKVPDGLVSSGDHTIHVSTAVSPDDAGYPGSSSNKVIYTIAKDFISFTDILTKSNGCIWDIEFEDGSVLEGIKIPSEYTEGDTCEYSSTYSCDSASLCGQISDENDAMQVAARKLLNELDLNFNGKVDPKFPAEGLDISSSSITGIPFTFESHVQARTWTC